MTKKLTSEVVVAYSQCRRKAFLLLSSDDQGAPHEYVRLLGEQACQNRIKYLEALRQANPAISAGDGTGLMRGEDVLVEVPLRFHDLEADCDVLTKVPKSSSLGTHSYEPTIIVSTHHLMKEQKVELLFVGYVLG